MGRNGGGRGAASTPPRPVLRPGDTSPVSAFAQGRCGGAGTGFAPATWPPPDADADDESVSGRSAAEDTLVQWQDEVASLQEPGPAVGLHRVARAGRAEGDEELGSEADDDGGADAAAAANGDGPPSVASTLKTSTTITRVVDYIGRRMQEVHSEMQSPRRCASSHSAGFDDPQNVPRAQQVVFPPSRPTHTGCCEGPLDASSSASGSLTARSGNKTARQIEAKNSGTFPFLFARVVDEPDPEPESEPETEPGPESGSAAESEALDYMNPVSEWWSNLIRLRPGAPSRQAMLIRSTHDKLALMLAQKDERIEAMHSRAIALERSCKAAEIFSVALVAELQAIYTGLGDVRLAEAQYWADTERDAAHAGTQRDVTHARELADLQKRLEEAHAKEVAALSSTLQEEQRLKDEALKRVQQLLEEEAQLEEANRSTSDSVKKFLADLRAKDLELDNMRTLLAQKDNEIKLLQQQKETEMKLLAAEHLGALKSKDAELLKELEALSKTKMSEMEQALAKLRAEMKSKDDAYEAMLKKKDANLVDLENKHKAEIESLSGDMAHKADGLWAQLKAKEAECDEIQRKFEASRDSLTSQLNQREEMLRELQRNLEDSRGEIDRMKVEIQKEKEHHKTAEGDVMAKLRATETERDELQRKLSLESTELSIKEQRLQELTSSLKDAKTQIERLKAELSEEVESRQKAENNGDTLSRALKDKISDLERRLEISERDSSAEIARLQAEIERLKALLKQAHEMKSELEEKLRLAEEAMKRAKLVGIGMRITDEAPHRVTEIVEGSAAHLSGAIQVGDYILEVATMDASKHSIADIRNFILGPAGSYLDLKLDRRGEDNEPNVFTVKIKRAEMPTGGHARPTSASMHAWQSTPHMMPNKPEQRAAEAPKLVAKAPQQSTKSAAAGTSPDASGADAAKKKKKPASTGYVPGPFF